MTRNKVGIPGVGAGWRGIGLLAVFWAVAAGAGGVNLLQNPGFEEEGSWEATGAASLRNQWRSHDNGDFNAAILGLWATQGQDGMIQQSGIAIEPGTQYQLTAWLWADLGWRPQEQYLAIAFQDASGEVLDQVKALIPVLHPYWTPMKCQAIAPSNAVSARVRVGAAEVSPQGALTIDEVSFEVLPAEPEDAE